MLDGRPGETRRTGRRRVGRPHPAADIEAAPFGAGQVEIAVDAFRRFGKGRHPAGLNFGDCFSYALAKATGEPLLFKGDDFIHTDVTAALVP